MCLTGVGMSSEEHKTKQFNTEIGSKATIEHHTIENDQYTTELREVLSDIGRDLQRVGKVPAVLTYCGSFSVHVYKGGLQNFAFAGVNNPGECHYLMADAALKKLRQDIEEHYKGHRQKLRSGF